MSDTPAVNDPRSLKASRSKLATKKQVIESDKTKLVESAVQFTNVMMIRRCVPFLGDSITAQELELTEQEEQAYNAALRFLAQQFESGPTAAKVYDVEAEQESESEYGEAKDES